MVAAASFRGEGGRSGLRGSNRQLNPSWEMERPRYSGLTGGLMASASRLLPRLSSELCLRGVMA